MGTAVVQLGCAVLALACFLGCCRPWRTEAQAGPA
ncbi:hypothetical protein SVIOM74S_07685 [Streptomyces violarus]